jgi:AcrR family transcriptional regulator
MTPRPYNRRKRAVALEETRRRITEATVALHGERGIHGTSYADIARQADVSIPTVYAHFPDLDHLVEACAGHLMQRFKMPGPGIFEDCPAAPARLERLVDRLFALYADARPWLRREAVESEIPLVRQFHEGRRAALRAIVHEALAPAFPAGVPEDVEAVACVLLDHSSYGALSERLGADRARAATYDALSALLPAEARADRA